VATLSIIGDGASLYDAADYALCTEKTNRPGLATLYAAEHEARMRWERAIESALQGADLAAEMDVHFQPVIDSSLRVTAVEALARWTSPKLGGIRPGVFIPLAERNRDSPPPYGGTV
jgi:predicted signal transduction protein with EAL and GGDEF domain